MTSKRHWKPAYVGLGSNLSGPVGQIEAAIDLLRDLAGTRVIAVSPFYRSAPFGGVEQPDFVNAVAALLTDLEPAALLAALKGIEAARGRDHDVVRWGPRVIDLDLLVYSDHVVEQPGLTVPHPGIAERNFVLLPLNDVAPGLSIPGVGRIDRITIDPGEPHISRVA